MATNEKKTIATLFDEIIEGYALSEEHKAFLEKRKEQALAKAKANSTAQAKKNKEREQYKATLLGYMQTDGGKYRVSELVAKSWNTDNLSAPNVTNMLTAMVKEETVKRIVEKGISYYSAV
jgi:hypothetical protein